MANTAAPTTAADAAAATNTLAEIVAADTGDQLSPSPAHLAFIAFRELDTDSEDSDETIRPIGESGSSVVPAGESGSSNVPVEEAESSDELSETAEIGMELERQTSIDSAEEPPTPLPRTGGRTIYQLRDAFTHFDYNVEVMRMRLSSRQTRNMFRGFGHMANNLAIGIFGHTDEGGRLDTNSVLTQCANLKRMVTSRVDSATQQVSRMVAILSRLDAVRERRGEVEDENLMQELHKFVKNMKVRTANPKRAHHELIYYFSLFYSCNVHAPYHRRKDVIDPQLKLLKLINESYTKLLEWLTVYNHWLENASEIHYEHFVPLVQRIYKSERWSNVLKSEPGQRRWVAIATTAMNSERPSALRRKPKYEICRPDFMRAMGWN